MILSRKDGTIKRPSFDGILKDRDGNTLSTGFTENTVSNETGSTLDGYTINIPAGTSFVKGDEVLIVEPDGLERQNVVELTGEFNIKLQERLTSHEAGRAVTVKPNFKSITLDLDDNELYYFADHEVLMISDTFFNIQIPFQSISARFGETPVDINMKVYNKEGKESIYGDFSFDAYFFRKLDMGQLTELLKLKIVAMLEDALLPPENTKHATNYANFKQEVVNILSITEDGEVDPDIIEGGTDTSFSMDFDWGV